MTIMVRGCRIIIAMVLNIGSYGAAGYLSLSGRSFQTSRTLGDMTPPEPPAMLNRRQPDFSSAGFGKDSVSLPGVAIRTIRRGVESARDAVPTVEELRSDLRSRLSQEREAREAEAVQRRRAEQAQRPPEEDPVERTGIAMNRSFGDGDGGGGASVQINGQVMRYLSDNEQTASPVSPGLDILA